MNAMSGTRMKNPAHPGGFVKSEIIEALELSVTDAAKVLGVTRPALSALLNQRAALSSEMALRIEKAFGVSMDTLMRMQNSYDIAQARRRAGQIKVARFARKVGDPARRPHDRLRERRVMTPLKSKKRYRNPTATGSAPAAKYFAGLARRAVRLPCRCSARCGAAVRR